MPPYSRELVEVYRMGEGTTSLLSFPCWIGWCGECTRADACEHGCHVPRELETELARSAFVVEDLRRRLRDITGRQP